MKKTETRGKKAGPKNPRLAVNIAGLKLKNPVMTASGTFGYGEEYLEFVEDRKSVV